MYAKLGTIKSTYPTKEYSDFMIFSEVVDSQLSYESPKVVRTSEELDIWFGKDYSQRAYHDELLRRDDVSLILYKPIKSVISSRLPSGYTYINETFFAHSDLEETESRKNRVYRVYEEDGPYTDSGTGLPYDEYVCWMSDDDWNKDESERKKLRLFVKVSDLPTTTTSDSLKNRDTLQINTRASKLSHSCPAFRNMLEDSYGELKFKGPSVGGVLNINGLDYDRIERGYQTYAFMLTYTDKSLGNTEFLLIQTTKGNTLYCTGEPRQLGLKDIDRHYDRLVNVVKVSDILGDLLRSGFARSGNVLYSTFPSTTTYFYRISGFTLEPSKEETYNLLGLLGDQQLRFWSKTVGTAGEDGRISVSIESLGGYEVRIILGRYEYEEVYEGTTQPGISEERIDYIIEKESSLVHCALDTDNNTEPIREGTWYMYGAIEEEATEDGWNNSMILLLEEETLRPDFLLIPDLTPYGDGFSYTTLLEKLKSQGCQALIGERGDEWKRNYTGDDENWLIYFYGDPWWYGVKKPPYFLYLKGLLEDIYSYSTDKVYYLSPLDGLDPYDEKVEALEKAKCNYLTDNGHVYYYRTYFDGDNPISTGWMRFVLGKVARELEKNKWSYLSHRMVASIQTSISDTLGRIKDNFSIIRSLEITDFIMTTGENKISLTIDTAIADLVGSDMTLDLTINFNN